MKVKFKVLAWEPQYFLHFHSQFDRSIVSRMSRKATIVEEFDDDTDLPLPSHPLPNTGSRGPLLEEMHIFDDEFEPTQRAGSASQPSSRSQARSAPSNSNVKLNSKNTVTDITPYKTCVALFQNVCLIYGH